jgi:flagellar biosynthesis/type III secretory pathway protein FliH
VVRLTGPRRVEIHTPGTAARVASPGETLTAPGVLRNPVPVEALYDREAGRAATLRNLLQREGYADLDAVLEEGVAKGLAKGEKEGLEKGIAKGKKEGRKEGLEKGIAKGKKEGRKEGLEKGIAKGKRAGKKEGMAIGLEKGITRGQQQGKKLAEQLFILLLEKSFGTVPAPVIQRIATAPLEQIEQWTRQVVTAACLDDVFN